MFVSSPSGARIARVIDGTRTRYYKGHDLAPIQFGFDHHESPERGSNPLLALIRRVLGPLSYRAECFFAQYPLGGFSIPYCLHHFSTALSETPKRAASLEVGYFQTSRVSRCFVGRFAFRCDNCEQRREQ